MRDELITGQRSGTRNRTKWRTVIEDGCKRRQKDGRGGGYGATATDRNSAGMYIAANPNKPIPSESSSAVKLVKAMGMWELQEPQQGLKLAHPRDLIKTQSRSLPGPTPAPTQIFFFFFTQTLLDKCTYNHAHTEKYINFKSHMDKHILSRAIALRPISNYPQHRGRKMMYKTQFNILSYLWLWPMTRVYLHYTVAHSKSFTSVGDYWRERRKRQPVRLHIWASSNASQAHFGPFSPMPQTIGPVCLQLHGPVNSFRCNNIRSEHFPGQHSLL